MVWHLSKRPPRIYVPRGRPMHVDVQAEVEERGFPLASTALAGTLTALRRWMQHPSPPEPPRPLSEQTIRNIEVVGLRAHLRAIWRVIGEDSFRSHAVEPLGSALVALSAWAEGEGATTAALAFAEAAFDAAPSAASAYRVGRIGQHLRRNERAERWLRFAVQGFAAADEQVAAVHVLALQAIAAIRAGAGKTAEARASLARARAIARASRQGTLEGDALHSLAVLDLAEARFAEAAAAVDDALACYGSEQGRVYDLAFDIAWMLLDTHGAAEAAQALLHALLACSPWEGRQIVVFASLARAAALLGRENLYEVAYATTWSMLREPWAQDHASPALVQLGIASLSLGFWTRAHVVSGYVLDQTTHTDPHWAERAGEISRIATLRAGDAGEPPARTAAAAHPAVAALVQRLTAAMQPREDGGPFGPVRLFFGDRRPHSLSGLPATFRNA